MPRARRPRALPLLAAAGAFAGAAVGAAADAAARAAVAQSPIVSELRLGADALARARLLPYVKLAEGAPLDPSAVAESVRLLFATGEFEDVVVETQETATGVAVVFRLLPAPRMTALRVAGDRVLSVKELRRLTRLRWNEPLWPARLAEAEREAKLALVAEGYLEARVSVRAEPGERGAVAVFEVEKGALAVVESAVVTGAPAALEPLLATFVRPRAGQAYKRARAEKAAETMRRELRALGHWRAAAEPREDHDPGRTRVKLRFEVTPGPQLSVGFRGSRVPAELRRTAERLVREGNAQEDALEEALDRIEQGLRERGHRSASVTRREEATPGGVEVVYQVEAGEAALVASVRVVGAEELSSAPALLTRPGAPLRDDLLERDSAFLLLTLHEAGFGEAQVEAEAAEGGGPQAVVFRVRAGTKSVVSEVELLGNFEPLPKLPVLHTRSGDPYRVRTVALDKNALLAAWREQGYALAEVEPEIERSEDKGSVAVRFRIVPGRQSRTGEIVVAGLERTQEQVVRRSLGMEPGDPFSLSRLLEAQRRLQGLGIFEQVDARALLSESAGERPLVVALDEAPRAAVTYGLGYAERDLLRGSVELTLRNLGGMDRSLSTFARLSFRGSRLVATYREPQLFGRPQELFVTGFREEQERDNFDFIRYGGQAQAARPVSTRLTLIGRLTYQRTAVFNVTVPEEEIDRQFRNSTFAGPSASLVLDTRDDPLDPKRGRFVSADLALSHGKLGGDSFAKAFVQAAAYAPLGGRLVVALSSRLGLGRTFRDEPPRLPLPDRFFAGGDYTMRGFAVDAVDPEGGNGLLLGSAELRFSPRPRFELAAFSDVGNVYPLASDISLRDMRYTAGLGLRYKSTIGPLRLDWGYKLNRRPGEQAYQVHVTVGHAF